MNRRQFTSIAVSGVALALARPAFALDAPEVTRDKLIARARRALEWHRADFALRDRVAIADFSPSSATPRLYIVDLISGTIAPHLVAHGKGSDPDHSGYLERFSNEPESLATCAGAFITGDIYEGVHGASMRLKGLDPANTHAEDRAIVIHGAPYVSATHVATWGKLGRSEGCFAVDEAELHEILAMLGPGRMLYADRA